MSDKTMNEKIDFLFEKFSDKKTKDNKIKKFDLPFLTRFFSTLNLKKGKTLVLMLCRNKNFKPLGYHPIINESITIDKGIFFVSAKNLFLWNGKIPCIIIKEWDMLPLCIDTEFDKTAEKQSFITPQKIIIRAIEMKENKMLSAFGNKNLLLYVLIAGVILYFLFGA